MVLELPLEKFVDVDSKLNKESSSFVPRERSRVSLKLRNGWIETFIGGESLGLDALRALASSCSANSDASGWKKLSSGYRGFVIRRPNLTSDSAIGCLSCRVDNTPGAMFVTDVKKN